MSLKKSTKRFVLTTQAKNSGGFYVRTSGIDIKDYPRNPVLLYDHDTKMILGNAVNLSVEGNKITFTPAFDMTDPDAVKIYNKVENGSIRMSSAGLKPPFKFVKDENGDIWLEQSKLRECTICLFGANPEALADGEYGADDVKLYDENNEQIINLSEDFIQSHLQNQNQNSHMKTIQLNASKLFTLLQKVKDIKLTEEATPEQVTEAIQELVALNEKQATKLVTLTEESAAAKAKADKAEADLVELKATQAKDKLVNLVDKAVEDRKITADQKADFLGLNYDTAKSILDKFTANPTIEQTLKGAAGKSSEKYLNMSWDELEEKGLDVKLKEENFELYKTKYKEEFKEDFVEAK